MPRKYRSPSPVKRRKNEDSYKRNDRKSPRRSYRSRSPEYKSVRNRKNKKYYSDSESESDDYSSSETESSESSESNESDSEEEYSKRGRQVSNKRDRSSGSDKSKKGKKSKHVSDSENEDLSPRYNEKENKNKKIHLSKDISDDDSESHKDDENFEKESSKYQNKKSNIKREQLQSDSNDNLSSGPPKYRVISFNGEELTVRKLYTSNIGPKNAAQKAFNKMCDKLNEKMEITVEKFGDNKGKVMTYFFMKQELDPPIEREIGGKKVVYRHKTISC
jgi:hypothetical protein